MELTSQAFKNNSRIPSRYTGEGENISPPLQWSDLPADCKELALICEDPDAPVRPGKDHPFVHWLVYNIPTEEKELHEAIPKDPVLKEPFHVYQGRNSFNKNNIGYGGPMPPSGHGVHHYIFKLYALDSELRIDPGLKKEEVMSLLEKHKIDTAELVGTYERKQ